VFSDDQGIGEISATALGRSVSSVLDRVEAGERLIVTRNGEPAAVIVSIDGGVDLHLAGSERFALLRREAREELDRGITRALGEWRGRGFG
jgi:prevent-host-death family protein